MLRKFYWLIVAITGFALITHAAHATTHEFYKGKTLPAEKMNMKIEPLWRLR